MLARFLAAVAAITLLSSGLAARDDKKDDKDLLQGDWTVLSMENSGNKVAAETLKDFKLTVKGSEWGGYGRKFTFKLDPAKKPKELDLTAEINGNAMTWKGIYKLDGDTLTVCRTQVPDGARPSEFKSEKGVSLVVYKRAAK